MQMNIKINVKHQITIIKQFQLYNNKIIIHLSLLHLGHLGVGSCTDVKMANGTHSSWLVL